MASFITLDAELYENFRTVVVSDEERYELLLKHSSITGIPDNERAVIAFDYFFLNVNFCLTENLSFEEASRWLNLIEKIYYTACFEDTTLSRAAVGALFSSSFKELQSSNPGLYPLHHVSALATFFAKGFLQHLEAYQYVCTETNTEELEKRNIMVQTPLIPLPTMESFEAKAALAEAAAAHVVETS